MARGRSEDGEPDPRSAQTRLSKLVKSFLRKAGGLDMNDMVLAAIGHDGVAIKPRLDNRLKPLETLAITAPPRTEDLAIQGRQGDGEEVGLGGRKVFNDRIYLFRYHCATCDCLPCVCVTVYHVFVYTRKHGLAADYHIFNPGQTF